MGKPLVRTHAKQLLSKIEGWELNANGKIIYRDFELKNFMAAIRLINGIAKIAESENHHPDIHLTSYRKLRIELSTHAIGGLSENDFILAGKINQLPIEIKS